MGIGPVAAGPHATGLLGARDSRGRVFLGTRKQSSEPSQPGTGWCQARQDLPHLRPIDLVGFPSIRVLSPKKNALDRQMSIESLCGYLGRLTSRLDGRRIRFASSDSNGVRDVGDEDLSVTDLARLELPTMMALTTVSSSVVLQTTSISPSERNRPHIQLHGKSPCDLSVDRILALPKPSSH